MNKSIYVWEGADKKLVASNEAPFHLAKAGEELEVGIFNQVDTVFIQAPIQMVTKRGKADEDLLQAKRRWAADTQGKSPEPKLT